MTTTVAWSADWHLGVRQYGLKRREQDFEDSARLLVKDAVLNWKADVLIVAGDILDSNRPSPEAIACLRDINDFLVSHQRQLLVISGNHDASKPHWIDVAIPKRSNYGIKLADWKLWHVNDLKIFGLPSLPTEEFRVAVRTSVPPAEIIMFHQLIREFAGGGAAAATLTLADLPTDRAQVLAGGDIHKFDLREVRSCLVGYPGSIELKSLSEQDDKYYVLLTFTDGRLTRHKAIPLATRPVVRVNLKNNQEVEELISQLKTQTWTKAPIVYADYLITQTHNVTERLRTALNPDTFVLQPRGYVDEANLRELAEEVEPTLDHNLSPQEFLKERLPSEEAVRTLAEALIAPDLAPEPAINQWLENQLH